MNSRPKAPDPRLTLVRLPVAGRAEVPSERADAARNRARILSAARRLLGRRPIHEICMDELAKAAGVGKGTLYRRFADRSSLCHALLDDGERELQERVLARFGLPADAKALAHLFALLEALVIFAMDNAALLAEAAAFERGQVERFAHPVHAWRAREIARLIDRAAEEGSVPKIDARLTAELFLSCLDPDLMRKLCGEAGEDLAALRERYLAFFARSLGLAAKPHAAPSPERVRELIEAGRDAEALAALAALRARLDHEGLLACVAAAEAAGDGAARAGYPERARAYYDHALEAYRYDASYATSGAEGTGRMREVRRVERKLAGLCEEREE